jgi:hypothetical protein
MIRQREPYYLLVTAAALGFWAGCEERRPADSERGRVNVHVDTPAGQYGVDVEYPEDRDKEKDKDDDDNETKVKIDHD